MMKSIRRLVIFFIVMSLVDMGIRAYSQEKDAEEKAMVFSVSGDVKLVPYGENTGVKCKKNMAVHAGDWIKTGPRSSVTLAFDDAADNVITIEEDSLVVIKLDGYFKVQLLRGDIYAILEDVKEGNTFRILTPSVVTESLNSGWGASSDGSYTNVMVFDDRVLVCGIKEGNKVDKKKYWIQEGYQRKTITFEDPGKMESAPKEAVPWFKEQVVAHHLAKKEETERRSLNNPAQMQNSDTENNDEQEETKKRDGEKKAISDNKETDLLEYLYKQRLHTMPKR